MRNTVKCFGQVKQGHSDTLVILEIPIPIMKSSSEGIGGRRFGQETKLPFRENTIDVEMLKDIPMDDFFQ